MSNRADLRLAILQLGREDTAAGGLVPLMGGKTRPIVRWKDPDSLQGAEPVIGLTFRTSTREGGAPDGYTVTAQFDAIVPPESDGLEEQLLDRLRDAVLTQQAFAAKGLDVSVEETSRPDTSELTGDGFRATARYRLRLRI